MKKLLASCFFLLFSSVPAARAELLYFMADAEDWDAPETFDFAMIGVSKCVNGAWTTTWGADGSQMYLRLYGTMDSASGDSAAATKAQVRADFGSYTRGSDALDGTAVGWADVSGYLTDDYKFYIEVYADGKGYGFLEESQTYGQLLASNHIYLPGNTDAQPVTPWTVPEPTSGLLLLVGAGLAAWRRRARLASRGSRPRGGPGDARRETRAALAVALAILGFSAFGADAQLERGKLELVVEEAGEMLADANRRGSATHGAAYRYFFGLIYGSGTNILARKDSQATKQLQRRYMDLVSKNYAAYTKVEEAFGKAAATGSDVKHVGRRVVSTGSRHRAKRIANAEKLRDDELAKAIREWEAFATQLKKTR